MDTARPWRRWSRSGKPLRKRRGRSPTCCSPACGELCLLPVPWPSSSRSPESIPCYSTVRSFSASRLATIAPPPPSAPMSSWAPSIFWHHRGALDDRPPGPKTVADAVLRRDGPVPGGFGRGVPDSPTSLGTDSHDHALLLGCLRRVFRPGCVGGAGGDLSHTHPRPGDVHRDHQPVGRLCRPHHDVPLPGEGHHGDRRVLAVRRYVYGHLPDRVESNSGNQGQKPGRDREAVAAGGLKRTLQTVDAVAERIPLVQDQVRLTVHEG